MKRAFMLSLLVSSSMLCGASLAADSRTDSDVVVFSSSALDMHPLPPQQPRIYGSSRAISFFANFDLNADGMVTRQEVDQAVAGKLRETTGGSSLSLGQYEQIRAGAGEGLFRQLDKNGDGTLSESELAARGAALFSYLDRNRDGIITRDEVGPASTVAPYRQAALEEDD